MADIFVSKKFYSLILVSATKNPYQSGSNLDIILSPSPNYKAYKTGYKQTNKEMLCNKNWILVLLDHITISQNFIYTSLLPCSHFLQTSHFPDNHTAGHFRCITTDSTVKFASTAWISHLHWSQWYTYLLYIKMVSRSIFLLSKIKWTRLFVNHA